MTTGKSSVGALLARRLGWVFLDTDDMIEKQTGSSIATLFATAGEAPFRDLESKTVELVALMDRAVIATGGGVPLRASNMKELEKNGFVVCLTARPETVVDRLKSTGGTRPLLKESDPHARVVALLNARRDAYARCGASVATDGLSPEEVAERVLAILPAGVRP